MFPSFVDSEAGAGWWVTVKVVVGFASTGVMGVASFACRLSRFFSAVLRNALVVIRNDLLGLQSSAEIGVCSQTGHVEGSDSLPATVSDRSAKGTRLDHAHSSRKSSARSRVFGRH